MANVALIVAATLLSVVLLRSHLAPAVKPAPEAEARTSASSVPRTPSAGDALNLPEINWQKGRQTLLLALSTSCHFCAESAPFYHRLSKERDDSTRLIALLPQDATEGERYLKQAGVALDEVKQAGLGDLGVRGTPTLILADENGRVITAWEGKLDPEREKEVLGRIRPQTAKN